MESLFKESYSLKNASSKREPREFAQRMLRTAKEAVINNVGPRLDLIYTNINLILRMYLQRPTEHSTIDSCLTELDDRKYERWAYASRKVDHRSDRPQQRHSNGQRPNQGQYFRLL